jgi:transcriptional regulator with XRE-family HTH domain
MSKKMGPPISSPELTGDPDRDRIIALRRRLGVSRKEFGERIGVTEGAVRGWENGTWRPSGPALKLLEMLERDDGRKILEILEREGSSKVLEILDREIK